jgi:hypothetical protein
MDFALVGKITIKAGTGGLTTPDQKVQNLGGLVAAGLLSQDEGKDAARPAFSKKLGLPPNPHEQRIERQITAFLKGPPSAEWAGQWTQYTKEKAAYDAQQQQVAAQQQADAVNAPVRQAAEQEQAKEAAKHRALMEMEQTKAQSSLQVEEAKHRMALEAKQADADIAARAPQPQPAQPPEIIVPPPDMAPIADVRNLVAAVLSKEPTPQAPQEPPVVHNHVQPAAATVHVAPQVHVPAQAAPQVNVPAPAKRKKRKGTITGPKGETHTIEVDGDE